MATSASGNLGFPKGSYGFKMSKKVAELTQVVHMLFTRNHEREVEIDELKVAYEQEVSNIIQDARGKIDKLEYQLREAERRRKKEFDQATGNSAKLLREAQEMAEGLKRELVDEKKESTQLRDLLTQAHKDLERLKHGSTGVSEDLIKKEKMLEERERENHKLRNNLNEVDAKLKANYKYADEMKKQMEISQEESNKYKTVIEKLNKMIEEANKKTENAIRRCKLTEEEAKYLKRELNKKNKEKKERQTDERRPTTASSNSDLSKYSEEDIERMKKEIEWLRLEIKNREGNFNKVFASFQPVFLNGGQKSNPENVQDRKMMMVTPSSSFSVSSLSGASPTPTFGLSSYNTKRRLPNLTGLEPSVESLAPGTLVSRPTTRSGSSLKNKKPQTLSGGPSNFRLIYTK